MEGAAFARATHPVLHEGRREPRKSIITRLHILFDVDLHRSPPPPPNSLSLTDTRIVFGNSPYPGVLARIFCNARAYELLASSII